ncbi:MAG: methyltransferase [Candidatus Heimdallarchaeota archaeon]
MVIADDLRLIRGYFSEITSFEDANDFLLKETNIQRFFSDQDNYKKFLSYLHSFDTTEFQATSEWGDVQTPFDFVKNVYAIIKNTGFNPERIIEPTCGKGNFLLAALDIFPELKQMYGIEIQEKHLWSFIITVLSRVKKAKEGKVNQPKINLKIDDIFSHIFPKELRDDSVKSILVIGNPPWVTASELSRMDAMNIPAKSNIKNFSGIEAIMGRSNFDISENIIIKMIENFSNQNGKLAFLCKTSVIRNIMKYLPSKDWEVGNIRAIQFDAKKVFGKTCDASLLLMDLNMKEKEIICSLSNFENPDKTIKHFGWVKNKFVADIQKYQKTKRYDGKGSFTWRQGVKHDATKILELKKVSASIYRNKLDEVLTIEDNLVYPLQKGSNIRNFEPKDKMKRILLPQKSLKDDTEKIKELYPKTWQYLSSKEDHFKKRKSRIYKNKNDFAIFGIGDYAFKSFKVAIAGFYKTPYFALLQPIENKPVIVDDTCYYLGFETYSEALFVATALNSKLSLEFFESIVFLDAKRPFTKEMLMRLDVNQIINEMEFTELEEIWNKIDFENTTNINSSDFEEYKKRIGE